jgi:hypothetical protein
MKPTAVEDAPAARWSGWRGGGGARFAGSTGARLGREEAGARGQLARGHAAGSTGEVTGGKHDGEWAAIRRNGERRRRIAFG